MSEADLPTDGKPWRVCGAEIWTQVYGGRRDILIAQSPRGVHDQPVRMSCADDEVRFYRLLDGFAAFREP